MHACIHTYTHTHAYTHTHTYTTLTHTTWGRPSADNTRKNKRGTRTCGVGVNSSTRCTAALYAHIKTHVCMKVSHGLQQLTSTLLHAYFHVSDCLQHIHLLHTLRVGSKPTTGSRLRVSGRASMSSNLRVCMYVYIHAYRHTCMLACIHAYIHTYKHAYIYT